MTEGAVSNLGGVNYPEYRQDYPDGADLHPRSKFHQKLLERIMSRARASHDKMKTRFSQWQLADRMLTVYVEPTQAEALMKAKYPRKPIDVVVGVGYAVLDTLCAFWTEEFLADNVFGYEGVGPEDKMPSILLEHQIAHQVYRSSMELALHTMGRDAFAYGFGAVCPLWTEHRGDPTGLEEPNWMLHTVFGAQPKRRTERRLIYEGNRLESISPFHRLPDPNATVEQPGKGEFEGFALRDNLMAMLREEDHSEGKVFNVKYLKHGKIRESSLFNEQQGEAIEGKGHVETDAMYDAPYPEEEELGARPVDRLYMFIDIIPKDWQLGKSEQPEKWLFGVAGDAVIITARPMGLRHGEFPVASCAPDFDGHSTLPMSRIESFLGIHESINFMVNAQSAAQRKSVNNMHIYDPSKINPADMMNTKFGLLARLKPGAYGTDIRKCFYQVPFTDVTQQNTQNIMMLMRFVELISGVSQSLSGILQQRTQEISATEARDVRASGMARIGRAMRMAGIQGFRRLGHLLASQTQQFLSEETYIEVTGELEERLRREFIIPPGMIRQGRGLVRPIDLVCEYDVKVRTGSSLKQQGANELIQLMQMAQNDPEIRQRKDIVRMFDSVARRIGIEEIADFDRQMQQQAPPMEAQGQVMPTEQMLREVEKGNLAPLPFAG